MYPLTSQGTGAELPPPDVGAAHSFLFADLAGFTALTEAHGDERAADLVGEFCERARSLLPAYGGEEVKLIGDAMMIRVAEADRAIRLALRLAREVGGRHGFPGVRVGLHTGPAVQRGGDWFGATVNLAARVSSIALAGEVLATGTTRAAAASKLPDLEFRPRGPQRFKNVSRRIEVFAAGPRGESGPARLVIDPVCQMAVDPGHAAATRRRDGRDHFFCSEACAITFDEVPGRALVRRTRTGELRASDRARERAARLLRSAYKNGRLELDELEERSAHIEAARTRAELRSVLRDLPEYRRWRRRMRRRRLWLWLLPRRLRRRFL
jgi:adenylate cyclase